MFSISRIARQVLTALTLTALLAAPLAADAAPAESRAVATAADEGGWTGLLSAPWRLLGDLILSMTGADGTEDPPPPPPPEEEENGVRSTDPPSCPPEQMPGPCTDPNG